MGASAWHRRDQPIESGPIRPDARATNQEVAGSSPAGRTNCLQQLHLPTIRCATEGRKGLLAWLPSIRCFSSSSANAVT